VRRWLRYTKWAEDNSQLTVTDWWKKENQESDRGNELFNLGLLTTLEVRRPRLSEVAEYFAGNQMRFDRVLSNIMIPIHAESDSRCMLAGLS
jgi:hypothetical protein